jgi:hypothetical protein
MAAVGVAAAAGARLAMGLSGGTGKWGAIADLAAGGLAFSALAVLGIRFLGDAPVRELGARLVGRVVGRLRRRR